MTPAPSNRFLYLLVFVVGISTLGAEIAAARLMAPFFGASTIVWANTIGVVLVALSVGYWLGGRLGDRYPNVRSLCLTVMAAAVLLALVPLVARPFFDLSVDALDEIEAGAFVGSLFAVLILIAIPVGLAEERPRDERHDRQQDRAEQHQPAQAAQRRVAVGHPAAEPVADRQRHQHDGDRVRPHDRRRAEERRHQPRRRDLRAERRGAPNEHEQLERRERPRRPISLRRG